MNCKKYVSNNGSYQFIGSFLMWRIINLFFLQEWLKSYSHRRYGKAIHQVDAAWEILYHTIYNCTDGIAVCILYPDFCIRLLHNIFWLCLQIFVSILHALWEWFPDFIVFPLFIIMISLLCFICGIGHVLIVVHTSTWH